MSGIPAQVEEAAELAEKLHEQMFKQSEEPEEGVINPEPAPEILEEDDEDDVPADDDVEELKKFKARYLTLKGKYDAEVPRLSSELRELKQSVFDRLEKVSQPKEEPKQTEEASREEILSQFAETYGEDFTENLRKLFALEAKQLNQPIQEAVTSIEETQIKTAQTDFVNYIDDKLSTDIPDWRDKWSGKDQKFIEFLQQPDPSGLYTMGQLAEMANQNWDADKLVTIFKLYKDTEAYVEPIETQTKRVATQQKQAMVAPSRQNTHTAPNTQSKQVWTQDMISEFQRLDRQGKYEADVSKAMWDDLLSAMGEGRIR